MISITLTGLGEIITVKNLKANTPITIDGEACIVTEKGANKFAETDMWEFPVLQPGSNTIVTDNVNSTLRIQYKPRWI
jgi:phage-related protein